MRIILCDDDPLITKQLENLLKEYFSANSLKLPEIVPFFTGEALLEDTGEKDIIFLDIEMPGLNGIYIGNELKKRNPDIIIFVVTSYSEYLDDAMKFHVFRYLSKPIDKQRLFRNLKDALHLYTTSNVKIAIETKNGIVTVSVPDIISVETQGRKVVLHTVSGDFESVHTMQYWINTLQMKCFFQPHRSFLVNMAHVTSFDHLLINLYRNQYHAYLTKRKYTAFKEAYLLYLESVR